MTTTTKINKQLEKDIELYRECEESLNTINDEIDRVNASRHRKEYVDYLLNLEQQHEQWFERLGEKKCDILDIFSNNAHIFDLFIDFYESDFRI